MGAIQMLHRAQMGVSGGGKYIKFADPEVLRVLLANGVSSDGVGITTADVEKVTSIGTWFKGNTSIKYFDEFEKFTGVTSLGNQAFNGCSNLTSIDCSNIETFGYLVFGSNTNLASVTLRDAITIGESAFDGCSNAVFTNGIPESVTSIYGPSFRYCAKLTGDLYLPNLNNFSRGENFRGCNLSRILSLGSLPRMRGNDFSDNSNLTLAILPESLTYIAWNLFMNCSSLTTLICKGSTPPTLSEGNNFNGTPIKTLNGVIYVPDASVAAYQGATNWASMASIIKGISSLQTDNPTLYNEIKDYL